MFFLILMEEIHRMKAVKGLPVRAVGSQQVKIMMSHDPEGNWVRKFGEDPPGGHWKPPFW